jgi:hypothetical protein
VTDTNPVHPAVGVSPDELASCPGLLLDLSLSLLPRRLTLASGLLAILGGNASDKVRVLYSRIATAKAAMTAQGARSASMGERFRAAREVVRAVANLEDVIFGLVTARVKAGTRIVPDATATH